MDAYRCSKEEANFVGMNPMGNFYCPPEKLKFLFYICIKNNFSILEKPDKEKQKLILDLDEKEKEITVVPDIVTEVEKIFNKKIPYIICRRKESFGIHLHFLGVIVTDKLYKALTKYLKKTFPIVDTSPFNHFIPGTGKPGKPPYLPVAGDLDQMKNFCDSEIFLLTKNFTGREKNWEYLEPCFKLEPEKIWEVKKEIRNINYGSDTLTNIITFCEKIAETDPACEMWEDYQNWIKVGFVLAYYDRFDLWERFSSLSEKFDADECEKKWDNFCEKTKYGNPKTIINMLKKFGYFFNPPSVLNRKVLLRKKI